jgi:acyl dehydratase
MRYYEDYEHGTARTAGTVSLSEREIVEFAERYDPLWLHTDEARAERESPFGGLIASGWQTVASCHGSLVHSVGSDSGALGSPGVEAISWTSPVYPDDELTMSWTVLDRPPSEKLPDRGLVTIEVTATNQREQEILSYTPSMCCKRKDVDQ